MKQQITLNDNRRNTIVGLGLTGYACARYLAGQKVAFRVVDSREEPSFKPRFVAEFPQITLECGAFKAEQFAANDRLILSPGIARSTPAIAWAIKQGAEVSSDIELFLQAVKQPVIAITGSNGKTTAVSMLAHVLNDQGIKAIAAGNIGVPVLDLLTEQQAADCYLLELSSFQLENLTQPAVKIASLLNISDDHMDRYDSMASYIAAKQRIYQAAEIAVYNRDEVETVPKNTVATCISFGLDKAQGNNFGLLTQNGKTYLAQGSRALLACEQLSVIGQHNWLNALAVLAICEAMKLDLQTVLPSLASFKGLPHRCQWVATIEGVDFYNDSKATNTGSVIAAIKGLQSANKNLVVIAGGVDKDSDFSELGRCLEKTAKHIVLIGQDADKIAAVLPKSMISYASSMESAVQAAYQHASAGDKVLLAPACASFDMFENYQHRGHVFEQAVNALQQEVGQ